MSFMEIVGTLTDLSASTCPFPQAQWRGVPALLNKVRSAPASHKTWRRSTAPSPAAKWAAVAPSLLRAFTFAPRLMSIFMIGMDSLIVAFINGVNPVLSANNNRKPLSKS
jgi:hypothetical protein